MAPMRRPRAPETALMLLRLGLLLSHPGLASRPLIVVLLGPMRRPVGLPLIGGDAPARHILAAAVLLLWPAVLLGLPGRLVLPLRAPKAVVLRPPEAAVARPCRPGPAEGPADLAGAPSRTAQAARTALQAAGPGLHCPAARSCRSARTAQVRPADSSLEHNRTRLAARTARRTLHTPTCISREQAASEGCSAASVLGVKP